jgi:uncharacterized protein (TIGR04551 family)
LATGDSNPGFGNRPGRGTASCLRDAGGNITACDYDGAKFAPGDNVLDIRNFRFNPGYRVDLVLWREILGGVTGAWYLKPSARYEIFDGLAAQLAIIYSRAMNASATPSTVNNALGMEVDAGLHYQSDDGFHMWFDVGVLQPLDGFDYPPGLATAPAPYFNASLSRGWVLRSGVAVKF